MIDIIGIFRLNCNNETL